MTNELGPAVMALQRKLEEQLQAVADTKRTINMLMKMSGEEPLFPDTDAERGGAVRADQFYGKGLATSAAEYLAMRQQACQPDEIYRGLQAGGFDFVLQGWKGEDRDMVRNVAMSLSKNTGGAGKFHRLKNGSFGLRAWYDPTFLKKAKAAEGAEKKKVTKTKKAKVPVSALAVKEKAAAKPKAAPLKPAAEKAQTKPRLSPEGIKRIAAAQKARWAKFKNKGPKLLPEKTSRPAADQTTQKAVAS